MVLRGEAGGDPTLVNHTACRDPDLATDFTCGPDQPGCEEGEPTCYITINSALSECCWVGGCPDGPATTSVAGTGFSCAGGPEADGWSSGSSTGWLTTRWPVAPGETFTLTFHVHDTSDADWDSTVVLDRFVFLTDGDPGTLGP